MMVILALTILALISGALLGFTAIHFKEAEDPFVDRIDALLPQTQCGQCGHPGCKPYAEAMANGESHNKCPPGGEPVMKALAALLNRDILALDESHGTALDQPQVAVIREDECIGCTKCIQACPVDAILGAAKQMHTVIESECTGCDLCVEPCPVDCIDMKLIQPTQETWTWPMPEIEKTVPNLIPVQSIS